MSERSDRLWRAWKDSRLTQSEAVERHGFNRNTLKSNLNGTISFSFAMAKRYARAFKVRAEWLYDGADPMREPPRPRPRPPIEVPVLSWVSAGRVSDIGSVEDVAEAEKVLVSDLPPGDYFETTVKGDSMDRLSPHGSRIIVNIGDRDLRSGRCYVFAHRGETTYKRYEREPVARLEPFSHNPTHKMIFLVDEDSDWNIVGRVVRSTIDLE